MAVRAEIAGQEMIAYSDNTATDMLLKFVGADKVRSFLAAAGLTSVKIPDSIRQLFLYLAGFPKGYDTDFDTFVAIPEDRIFPPHPPRSPLNDVVTSQASSRQLTRFYWRALRGEVFKEETTLAKFRELMSTGTGLIDAAIP